MLIIEFLCMFSMFGRFLVGVNLFWSLISTISLLKSPHNIYVCGLDVSLFVS